MSFRATGSMLLGACINYFILAPILINKGIIVGTGFKNITMWALWGGAAMMTTSSIYSFITSGNSLSSLTGFFKGLTNFNTKDLSKNKKKEKTPDILHSIELPKMVSYIGIPILGIFVMIMGKSFFGIDYWLSAIAIPLVFIFSIMAVKSTGVTAITPSGALGKMTQVTYAILAPGKMGTNLITAGITAEACGSASNLLMDIKPAYMLGGKPRHQAMGHAIGIICGGLAAIPVFYMMFDGDISVFTTEKFPMPGATVWKAVAEVLATGLGALHPTAQVAVLVGGIMGVVFEVLNQKTKGGFPLSPVAFGIAFVLPFHIALEFFIGSLIFWLMNKKPKEKRSFRFQTILENKESIGAGIIAGGSIVGIILMIVENTL